MPDQAVVFSELMRLVITNKVDAGVAGMRNHCRFPKRQEHGNGRTHPLLHWIALPHGIDMGTGFLHRPFYQTQHLGALLESWRVDIVAQDSPLTVDARLNEAHRFLAGDFSGGMAAHAITDDIQPEVCVDKAGILIVVTLTTNIRLSRGGNAHVRLTWQEVQHTWLCYTISYYGQQISRCPAILISRPPGCRPRPRQCGEHPCDVSGGGRCEQLCPQVCFAWDAAAIPAQVFAHGLKRHTIVEPLEVAGMLQGYLATLA